MFITSQAKPQAPINDNRYCRGCKHIGGNGYCSRVGMIVAKEKQSKEWVRLVDCLFNDLKEKGAGNDD